MEKDFVKWIDADAVRRARYADVIPAIDAVVAERAKMRERDALLVELSA